MSVMLTASSALDWAASLLGFGDIGSAVAAAEDRDLRADAQ